MSDHDKLREAIEVAREKIAQPAEKWWTVSPWVLRALVAAAESTLPKTKTVEVWHVEFYFSHAPNVHLWISKDDADGDVIRMQKDGYASCIRVTGPHQQEVPA